MTGIPVRVTVVWLGLMGITLLTWALGSIHPFHEQAPRLAAAIAISLGMLKAWLIGFDFMEIRGSHVALRAVVTVWVFVVGTTLVTLVIS